MRELFKNTLKGAQILGIDQAYQAKLQDAINRLHPYQIGKRGNLQEWYYDWDDQDWHHRHQSHLLGLHPFYQISLDKTPDLAAAAAKTLEIKETSLPVGAQDGVSVYGLACTEQTSHIL